MKARSIEGIDPGVALSEAAAGVLGTRLAELRSFMPAARDPARVSRLHDMRIAAKRVRYVLELIGEAAIGPAAERLTALVRELQEVLGDVHDCDELLPRLRAVDAEGVDVLIAHVELRRAERFARFRVVWHDVDEEVATSCSHCLAVEPIASVPGRR